jgi:hypothetical protein
LCDSGSISALECSEISGLGDIDQQVAMALGGYRFQQGLNIDQPVFIKMLYGQIASHQFNNAREV